MKRRKELIVTIGFIAVCAGVMLVLKSMGYLEGRKYDATTGTTTKWEKKEQKTEKSLNKKDKTKSKSESKDRNIATIEETIENDIPDDEVREDLVGKGYPPSFVKELLLLKSMMKKEGIKPTQIRNATLGGRKAREKFSKSLPPKIQIQVIKTIRSMIAPPAPKETGQEG